MPTVTPVNNKILKLEYFKMNQNRPSQYASLAGIYRVEKIMQ